ncbi:MAG: hypothetical protein IJM27_12645 [Eubacterium sp.]|nr:hypothetical protein [Eubacterium sp.]
MLKKVKKYLYVAVLIGAAFLFPKGIPAQAAAVNTGYTSEVSVMGVSSLHPPILFDEGGIGVNGSSGVTELDNAAKKTNKLINWICGWLGGIMALFGFIWAAMNQAGHNTESRNMGIIVAVVGIVIAFAPKIISFILG